MINVKNLVKNYGEKSVLSGVSFEVKTQEIFALLGPSGAGKTTIINILTRLVEADSGTAEVAATTRQLGLMLDQGGLYPNLSCSDNLSLYARIYGLPLKRVKETLESVGLGDSINKTVSKLSRGMTQRLALARAILYKPKLLILDEPTSALDPGTARGICKLLQTLRENGATIFLTTHNMDEALKLCDRVALLHQGEIIEEGSPLSLCESRNALKTVPDLEAVFLELTGVAL
ncbi:MAG: ABC transporter ATP-binding protein [Defluviitaleaceae bacterium]|nr:ABC transporter ATP-binding protein [Defluviitaleaceae bacterium]MCL2262464.1 ABC transporter ATP-binding protein [Defluviitaleaceae bacterium]